MRKKKRILFVCNYFAPENKIAAVRTSKLVKYFRASGYAVDVLTERKEHITVDETLVNDGKDIKIFYAENSQSCKALCAWYERIIKPLKRKRLVRLDNRERINTKTGNIEFYPFETAYPVIGSTDYLIEQFRQRELACRAFRMMKYKKYDILITSYGDSFSYFFGKRYKAKNQKIQWVFDIRDAIYRYKFTPDYVKWIPLGYEKYIWKYADAIVGVSKGICRRVPQKYRNKVFCITNGFEREEQLQPRKGLSSERMSFTYTGSMYGGLQNLSAFFETVGSMIEEGFLDKELIEFHYAGNESAYEIFKSQAEKYALGSQCVYHGKLTRGEAIQLQKNSDILLMASYDYKNNNGGVITGKLLEYLAAERPIIAIVTGDGRHSEVSQIIEKTNTGICCEASGGAGAKDKLGQYILEQYRLFKKKEPLKYNFIKGEIEKYDYRNISKKYIRLLQSLEGGEKKA